MLMEGQKNGHAENSIPPKTMLCGGINIYHFNTLESDSCCFPLSQFLSFILFLCFGTIKVTHEDDLL